MVLSAYTAMTRDPSGEKQRPRRVAEPNGTTVTTPAVGQRGADGRSRPRRLHRQGAQRTVELAGVVLPLPAAVLVGRLVQGDAGGLGAVQLHRAGGHGDRGPVALPALGAGVVPGVS